MTLIVVGSLKEKYWREAEMEYRTRLSPYVCYEVKECAEVVGRDVHDKARVMREEGRAILASIPRDAYVVVLAIEGNAYSSEGFARLLEKAGETGRHIVLVIGGSWGLSDEVYARADAQISLSPLTMTHQLARVVCAEQVYRAMTIVRGKAYHK